MIALRRSLIVLLLLAFLGSACTPSVESTPPTPRPSATAQVSVQTTPTPAVSKLGVKKEALRGVQVNVWYPWFGAEASLFETQIAEFNKINEWGIVVTAQGQRNYSELFTLTSAALKDRSNPDIVIALPEHALVWQDSVVDLNSYLNDPEYGLSALDVSDFANTVWMQDEVDRVRYGLPAQRTARFILYNQSWARELGFTSPPQTSADFEQQACAAHAALGKDSDPNNDSLGGWMIDTDPMTALSWMRAFDGGVQEDSGYRFLRPGNIDAFKFLKSLQGEGCAWVPSADLSVYDRFAGRQALFATASMEEFADQGRAFGSAGNKDEWVVLPFPGTDRQAVVAYGSSFVMFKSDDATQLASWLFMRWMLSPENQVRWVQSTGLFPLRSATTDLLGSYGTDHPQWAEAVKLLSGAQITPQLASWHLVRVMLGDGFNDMFDTIRRPDLTEGQVPVVLRQMDTLAADLNK